MAEWRDASGRWWPLEDRKPGAGDIEEIRMSPEERQAFRELIEASEAYSLAHDEVTGTA